MKVAGGGEGEARPAGGTETEVTHMTDDSTPPQRIINGNCLDVLAGMDENSVHAVVTDPPYGMAFMPGVNDWDSFDTPLDYQEWCEEWASEALRVLKPGGHLIAFSGTRTYGFLMCGVHAADFEIRDTITWHYGQGFGAGKTQDVTNWMDDEDDVEEWSGFKMGLKPATELAVLARKPLEGSTYANVLKHGTGALNVDGTRVPVNGERPNRSHTGDTEGVNSIVNKHRNVDANIHGRSYADGGTTEGRYPANLCIDPTAAAMLDVQSGVSESKRADRGSGVISEGSHDGYKRPSNTDYEPGVRGFEDSGGASRFFYTAKASPNERSINEQVENDHSTVKPLELMEWLVTLVTAEGQRVLDPFAGSGTTIMACRRLNREGVGIEMGAEHAELARKRVDLAHEIETDRIDASECGESDEQADDGPTTLESFADD